MLEKPPMVTPVNVQNNILKTRKQDDIYNITTNCSVQYLRALKTSISLTSQEPDNVLSFTMQFECPQNIKTFSDQLTASVTILRQY